jgi:type II secretory pathway pseudopilin PulG
LIELLVVIAIIGILAGMLLPVFATGKKKAQGIACMNNSKQLAMAVQLYTGEYHDFFPPNPDDGNTIGARPTSRAASAIFRQRTTRSIRTF